MLSTLEAKLLDAEDKLRDLVGGELPPGAFSTVAPTLVLTAPEVGTEEGAEFEMEEEV